MSQLWDFLFFDGFPKETHMVRVARVTMNNPPPVHVRTDKLFGGVSTPLLRHFTFGGQADTEQKAQSLFKNHSLFLV